MAIAFAVWVLRHRLGQREIVYAAAWILIPLLPALDTFVFRADELVHDRYFYVPSVGAALMLALFIEPIGKAGRVAFGHSVRLVATALVLAVSLALCTIRATSFWRDDYTLFTRAHAIAPRNAAAQDSLSVEWINRGQIDQAQALLEESLQDHPADWQATFNLGRLQYSRRQYAKAEEHLRQTIALNPSFADPYVTLGQIQLKENRLGEALDSMHRAVDLNPFNARFHTIYGMVLELNRDCPAAMNQFKAAVSLAPGDFSSQRGMARCDAATTQGLTSAAPPPR